MSIAKQSLTTAVQGQPGLLFDEYSNTRLVYSYVKSCIYSLTTIVKLSDLFPVSKTVNGKKSVSYKCII